MYVVYVAGGIASGKSTVAHQLEELGAHRLDLDELSREVTVCDAGLLQELARVFGNDVLDEHGALRRQVLANKAFASAEHTKALERIMHPAIRNLLQKRLELYASEAVCVVEIPLLDRVEDLLSVADEVLCVVCPLEIRRTRAAGRGMDVSDFNRRVAQQPSDEYLRAHAHTVFSNTGDEEALRQWVLAWWREREERGWKPVCAEGERK